MLTLAFAAQVIRLAVPYIFAVLGGTITERSGVIDLAIEAKLLFGAFAAAACGHAFDSSWAGIAGGMMAGALVALVQVGASLWLRAEQVIVGIALDLIAVAGTRFLLQVIYHEGANSPPAPSFGDRVLTNPLVIGAVLATALVPFALARTPWGLRLRAAGDRPDALVAVGVAPSRARLHAVLVGGALAGAGGAQLSLAVGGFSADMSSGRGYYALMLIILVGWRPVLGVLASLGLALASAVSIQLQLSATTIFGYRIPSELAPLLPLVLAVVVLTFYGGGSRPPPRALGKV